MHTPFDPHRPMRSWVAILDQLSLSDEAGDAEITATLPPVFRRMYPEFRRHHVGGPEGQSFDSFRGHIRGLDATLPTMDDLETAPELCRWSLVRRPASAYCQLTGYVTGHPQLDWGSPVVTSTVFRIGPGRQWARTSSRFYRLTEYDPTILERMHATGVISRDAQMVQID